LQSNHLKQLSFGDVVKQLLIFAETTHCTIFNRATTLTTPYSCRGSQHSINASKTPSFNAKSQQNFTTTFDKTMVVWNPLHIKNTTTTL